MSTRAAIGMKQPDGKIWSIYVHNDGFVASVGVILAGWYDTRKRVNALLKLGALSSLGENTQAESKEAAQLRATTAKRHGGLSSRPGRDTPPGKGIPRRGRLPHQREGRLLRRLRVSV